MRVCLLAPPCPRPPNPSPGLDSRPALHALLAAALLPALGSNPACYRPAPRVAQAKQVYEQRSPLNALDGFTKPVAFFQVRLLCCAALRCDMPCCSRRHFFQSCVLCCAAPRNETAWLCPAGGSALPHGAAFQGS